MNERNEKILKLRQQKLSHVAIANEMKLPIGTVRWIVTHQLGLSGRASENTTSEFWRTTTPRLVELYTTTSMTNAQLGNELGCSASAVASKLSKLVEAGTISTREKPAKVERPTRVSVVYDLGPPKRPIVPLPASTLALFAPEPAGTPFLAIEAGCRWPHDPAGDGQGFTCCGCKVSRPPYCDRHRTLAFAQLQPSPSCDRVSP